MNVSNMGVHNFHQAGFDAVTFSLIGMAIVFSGLTIIAMYIVFLPKLLTFSLRKKKIEQAAVIPVSEADKGKYELEILLAVASAFHLHQNFPEGSERITWKSHGSMESSWSVSGRMHGLSIRRNHNPQRKK